MSTSWYEDGQEVGMKLGMNMVKIFGRELFMAIVMISMIMDIDFPFPPNGDYLRCTYQFLMSQRSKK